MGSPLRGRQASGNGKIDELASRLPISERRDQAVRDAAAPGLGWIGCFKAAADLLAVRLEPRIVNAVR